MPLRRTSGLSRRTPLRQGEKGLTTRTPLTARSGLRTNSTLKRTAGPKARPRGRKRSVAERTQMEHWHRIVTADQCVMCQAIPVGQEVFVARRADVLRREGHHILAKRLLIAAGLEHLLWDPRNGMSLCRLHHHRHESWFQRVPRRLVPATAFDFAEEAGEVAEINFVAQLERDYPLQDGPWEAA